MVENINFGGFIISLDFELHWGVRDKRSIQEYKENLLGARIAIPKILDIFKKYDISATWGVVGFLFAHNQQKLNKIQNSIPIPSYSKSFYNPFQQKVGHNEKEDPFHYAPSLIKLIKNQPKQEIASHTTSHFYTLEEGQTAEEFDSDIKKSIEIANSRNINIHSIIYPRNQHNPNYSKILQSNGITSFRGNPGHEVYSGSTNKQKNKLSKRLIRLLDSYFNILGHKTTKWEDLIYDKNLLNIRASSFLRPYSNRLGFLEKRKINRIRTSMTYAAQNNELYHLYWHPHNFGSNIEQNIKNLTEILKHFRYLNQKFNFRSLSMFETSKLYHQYFN